MVNSANDFINFSMNIDSTSDPSINQLVYPGIKKNRRRRGQITIDSRAFNIELDKDQVIETTSKVDQLKQKIKKRKIQNIRRNFIEKLRLNSIYRQIPPECLADFQHQNNQEIDWISKIKAFGEEKHGLYLSDIVLTIWSFLILIQNLVMIFILTIMLTFDDAASIYESTWFRLVFIVIYVADIIINFTVQRYEYGKRLKKLSQISRYYINNGFWFDIMNIVLFLFGFIVKQINFLVVFANVLKLWNHLKRFDRFEFLYVCSTEREQYYGLVKLFLTNFFIGHFLSIFLNLMAQINIHESWYSKVSIINSEWAVKYIWGYYWGTNIMLTVGFGDLAANNHYQAIILIFIQTFSCITLAYNISEVGALISSMRQDEAVKKKKLKYIHRMCQVNQINTELESKISNFVEKEYQIKQDFQYDEYDAVLSSLPKKIQNQYRKEANKVLFDGLGILNLSKKSLLKMAQLVQRKICHPSETLQKKDAVCQFLILQQGSITLNCRNGAQSKLNGKVIETITVDKQDKPKVISLGFIKNEILKFDIKSQNYSIVYTLNKQLLKQSLKDSYLDYEVFCYLQDKDTHNPEESNTSLCKICKNKYHNKVECSKLHFTPIKQLVVLKYMDKQAKMTQKRSRTKRRKHQMNCFYSYEPIKTNKSPVIDKKSFKFLSKSSIYAEKVKDNMKKSKTSIQKERTKSRNSSNRFLLQEIEQIMYNYLDRSDSFWDIQCDQACNFNFYFAKNNPEKLNEKTKIHPFLLP